MQEYVISHGVLEVVDATSPRLEVIYGFLTLPDCAEDGRGALTSRISAISVQSVKGAFISPGRYRLTTNEGLTLLLERSNVGWQLVQELRLPPLFVVRRQGTRRISEV